MNALAKEISLGVMEIPMISPAKTKNGMANKGKEFMARKACWGTNRTGDTPRSPTRSIMTALIPKQNEMGIPMIKVMTKTKINTNINFPFAVNRINSRMNRAI